MSYEWERSILGREHALQATRQVPQQKMKPGASLRPAAHPPLRIVDPSKLLGVPVPEREWVVPEWLPVGHVTLLYADGGTGKTLLAQQLMAACATGGKWCGLDVARRRTLGFFCEDDEGEIHRRQENINRAAGIGYSDLKDVRWVSGVGQDNLLAMFPRDLMQVQPLYAQIREAALDHRARLVVVDTAANTFGGNENDRSQVRQFIGLLNRLAQEIEGAVLMNAHPSRSGMGAGGDLDGASTGWSNSARSRWSLERPKPDGGGPADESARVLTKRKANYSERGTTIDLRWSNGVLLPAGQVDLSFVADIRDRTTDETFMELFDEAAGIENIQSVELEKCYVLCAEVDGAA